MIVIMRHDATPDQIAQVVARIQEAGFRGEVMTGSQQAIVGVLGTPIPSELGERLELLPGVERTQRVSKPYKLASRDYRPFDTVIRVGEVTIGADEFVVMAGPCSVESLDQVLRTAHAVKAAGARILRGGAYKPRTSPYSFQGLGVQGLEYLARAREETGLPIITEVLDTADVPTVAAYADILQIGTRNMQNFALLRAVGRANKPVLLKRGMSATIEEWLMAAEYILNAGNPQVILCERGIRTFETAVRNTLDLSAIPVVKRLSHLPVIADPSHGTGKWYLVRPMALAAAAVGADGLLIEVHPDPDTALSDGPQSLNLDNFAALMTQLQPVTSAVGRHLPAAAAVAASAG
ncbi:MAG TPA: 3-deoxy-7-phosphoheptulonate synthase [Chloroflexota bacterium]|nr:3-deoxy-7-phosphoheptulonate synthase [Chloroflexota bacterium]